MRDRSTALPIILVYKSNVYWNLLKKHVEPERDLLTAASELTNLID